MTPGQRLATVATDLEARGFSITHDGNSVAASGATLPEQSIDAPLTVTELHDERPLTVISQVTNAAHEERLPVLVGDEPTVEAATELLEPPFGLAGAAPARRFHAIADRIRLTDDTFACVERPRSLQWREADRAATETDSPRLLLDADGETVAVLESVDGLACPGPSPTAFPYRYERGGDRQFRVSDSDGLVGRYSSITAMKGEFRPVPLPLVPEHHVRRNGALARAVVLASVEDSAVDYEAPAQR